MRRAERHLARFHELAGRLATGHVDLARLAEHEAGPAYLPEIDLAFLSFSRGGAEARRAKG